MYEIRELVFPHKASVSKIFILNLFLFFILYLFHPEVCKYEEVYLHL